MQFKIKKRKEKKRKGLGWLLYLVGREPKHQIERDWFILCNTLSSKFLHKTTS